MQSFTLSGGEKQIGWSKISYKRTTRLYVNPLMLLHF
jgi:hypothetical protein